MCRALTPLHATRTALAARAAQHRLCDAAAHDTGHARRVAPATVRWHARGICLAFGKVMGRASVPKINPVWEAAAARWCTLVRRAASRPVAAAAGQGDDANVAALFYSREQPLERYNMADTLKAQHTAHLTTGCVCYSDMGRILCAITADSCGWHDPLCGFTDARSIAARYGATRSSSSATSATSAPARACWWNWASTAWASATWSRESISSARYRSMTPAPCTWSPVTASAGTAVDLRFEMDMHRVAACGPASAGRRHALTRLPVSSLQALPQRPDCRRRCLPHALPGERARLHQHRSGTVPRMSATPLTRRCGGAGRRTVDGRGARRPAAAHRRSRRQPGRGHAVLQRRRYRTSTTARRTPSARRATST